MQLLRKITGMVTLTYNAPTASKIYFFVGKSQREISRRFVDNTIQILANYRSICRVILLLMEYWNAGKIVY